MIEVTEAAMLLGETYSPDAWRAIRGREPTAEDVAAMLCLRRGQGAVRRSDEELRRADEEKRKR